MSVLLEKRETYSSSERYTHGTRERENLLLANLTIIFVFTGVCSNCCKLLGDAENKATGRLSDVGSEFLLCMENMTWVSVNGFSVICT